MECIQHLLMVGCCFAELTYQYAQLRFVWFVLVLIVSGSMQAFAVCKMKRSWTINLVRLLCISFL